MDASEAMTAAERFSRLRNVVLVYSTTYEITDEDLIELLDLIETMEERWGLFSE